MQRPPRQSGEEVGRIVTCVLNTCMLECEQPRGWPPKAVLTTSNLSGGSTVADSIVTKVCPACNLELPRSEFYNSNATHDKLRERCIACMKVHRLIVRLLPADGHECCHNNGIQTDNRLENLRWDTRSANRQDAIRHGTFHGGGQGENAPGAKLTNDQVRYIRASGLTASEVAAMFGIALRTARRLIAVHSYRSVV